MANNAYNDKAGRYSVKTVTIETVDGSLYDYFDKKIALQADSERGRVKVPIIFASGERWKIIRDNKGLRDDNGTLILPLVTIRRVNIDRTPGFGGMAQEVPEVTVSKIIHPKTGNIQNLVKARNAINFVEPKRDPVIETLTIPYPDFCNIFYEITIWTQFQAQMNEILEKIFYSYNIRDSFVIPVDYDGKEPKGDGYYFVGFREGDLPSQSNVEEFTDQERIIKYTYNVKIPAYLILDPKDEALSYGREDGKKVVYKQQNTIDVKLKETILSVEDFLKLYG